jgi:rRNA processing protein Gar1
VGDVLHISKAGHIIIKTRMKLFPGTLLYDGSGRAVGTVIDIIGPVAAPFIVAKPLIPDADKLVGGVLYVRDKDLVPRGRR